MMGDSGIEPFEDEKVESRTRDLNARLEEGIRNRTRHLELMRDIAEIGNAHLSVGDAMGRALGAICLAMRWPLGHAIVRDRGRPESFVDSGQWYGANDERWQHLVRELRQGERTAERGLVRSAVATRESVWVADLPAVDDALGGIDPSPMRSMLVLPVLVGREVIAALEFFSPESRPSTADEVESLKYFGMQIGRTLERAELERQLADAALDEQRRLGRELHDTLGQQITAIGIMAQTLRNAAAGSERQTLIERVDRMLDAIHEAKQHTRAIITGLAPVDVDAGGLAHALEDLARQTTTRFEVRCDFFDEAHLAIEDNFTATQLYLLAKEAVHNAVKHAAGRAIVIRLEGDEAQARLTVEDDGAGLSEPEAFAAGRGMHIMKHRCRLIGAELEIDRSESGGTRIRVRFSPTPR